MSINLQKRTEKVGIVLAKRGLTKVPPVRVGGAFDISGSATWMYQSNGPMQETIDRLIPVAMKFDDNGELDAWLFHHGVKPRLKTLTEADEGTYVKKVILPAVNGDWGMTSYAPVLREVVDFYFGEKKSGGLFGMFGKKEAASNGDPAMLLFLTDGSNDDRRETEAVLAQCERDNKPVYFNMIGIGNPSSFSFIEEMADKYGNVGFSNLNDLGAISDDQLYDLLVNQEFVDWVKQFAK